MKYFIRSQVYRNLFFSFYDHIQSGYDNDKMTVDKNKYQCRTTKWYVNHDGDKKRLVLDSDGNVQVEDSGLSSIMIHNVRFSKITNVLQYEIHSDPIIIGGQDKFTYNDT